jgi:hypothetical protein
VSLATSNIVSTQKPMPKATFVTIDTPVFMAATTTRGLSGL